MFHLFYFHSSHRYERVGAIKIEFRAKMKLLQFLNDIGDLVILQVEIFPTLDLYMDDMWHPNSDAFLPSFP